MVPRAGLEPARTFVHGPSNRRVYQFRHRGRAPAIIGTARRPGQREERSIRSLRAFLLRHLTLVIFAVLAVAMAALTLNAVQSVPLEPSQRLWLVVAAVLLAALSAWIISLA